MELGVGVSLDLLFRALFAVGGGLADLTVSVASEPVSPKRGQKRQGRIKAGKG